MLLGEKNINAIVSTFCSSSTSQTDGDSTSTLICKRKAKNFGIPPKPFDERSFDKNVDCCNKENVNIDFPSSTLTSPLMKLPGLNDCAKCQKYEEMFTKLKEITNEDNDHHGKYSSVRKILNTLSTERSISPVYDTNLLSNTRVDKNLIKMIENDQESNEKVIEVDSFTKNSDLVHIDCVIEKGQGDIKDICSKPSSNCYVRNNSKHLNSQIEKNKSLLSREEKTTIHPLFIHNTIKENFDTSTPLRRSKRRSSASHIPTYYGENRSTTKTKKIVETDGSEKKPLRRRSSRRQTMSTVYVPLSAQSVKVTTRIARDDLQTRTSMLSLDKNDEKPSQSKRRKNSITCSLPIIQKKISENTPNVTKELDPQEAIATSITRDDLQIRTNILSLDKNDEKLVQSKRRRNSIACSLPIFKKIKSESIPNVAKEFDSRDIITPSKNSSDLSCRRKIPTIDDLSTSSGDERKRESNIAYDSSSDIDNNNNKDKRRTEQRRRTMAVNGSSPLLGKDRFLESQDSLCSSNSSSSEKECHIATDHTIVMKGKEQDIEELTNLSYHNSSEGSLIDDIKEPKCYEHRKVVDHDEKKIVRRATHHSCVPEEESKPRSSSLKISSLSNFSSPSTLSEYTVSTAFLVEKISPVEHSTDKMTRSHECKPTNSLSKNYEDTLDRNLNKIKAYGSQQNDFTSFNKDIPQASPKRVVSLPNPNIKSENSKSSSTVRTKRRSHRIRMTPKRYHDEKMMVESELPTTGSQNILSESRLSQNGTSFISTSIILPENTVAGNKRGKRRRRSLRLHVGGMINEDDIEQIEKETNARKLKRNLDLARNKENRATIYSKVRVRVRVNGEVDENELLSMQHVQKKENNTSLNKLGKIELQSGKHISEYKNMGNDYHTRPRSHQRQVEDGSVQPSSSLYDKLEIVKTKETFQENIEECKSNESGKIKENIIKQSQPVPTSDILYSVSKDRNGISESEKSCKYNRLIPSPALKKNFRWTKVSSDKALILRQNKSTKSLIKKKSAVRTSIGSTIIPSVDDIKDRISDLFGDSNVLKKVRHKIRTKFFLLFINFVFLNYVSLFKYFLGMRFCSLVCICLHFG